jgi:hypothetical protein
MHPTIAQINSTNSLMYNDSRSPENNQDTISPQQNIMAIPTIVNTKMAFNSISNMMMLFYLWLISLETLSD